MRIVVQKETIRRILRWIHSALFACAVLFKDYCAFVLADTWSFQRRESVDLDRLLLNRRVVSHGVPPAAANGLFGRIELPRLRFSAVVIEGIDKTTLRRAVGHIPGAALPGQPGNVALSGHRDTFFRPLKDLRIRDEIHFSRLSG